MKLPRTPGPIAILLLLTTLCGCGGDDASDTASSGSPQPAGGASQADTSSGGSSSASTPGAASGGAATTTGSQASGGAAPGEPNIGVPGGNAKGGSSSTPGVGAAGAAQGGGSASKGGQGMGTDNPGSSGSGGGWLGQGGSAGAASVPQGGAAGAGGAAEAAGGGSAICDHEKTPELFLSADDSTSMAAAAVARGLIEQGQYVYKALRTYEFLNYYAFSYAPAPQGEVAVSAQLHSNVDGSYNLQIGVRAPDQTVAERRPYNITLSVDVSSSMQWGPEGNTGLDRVRQACAAMASQLRQGDVVSIVTWADGQEVLLDSHAPQGADDPTLLARCASLSAYGRTDLAAGLSKAYDVAQKNFSPSRINRVILLSDGGANVSTETRNLIKNAARDDQGEAIYLMGAGVGDPWNYNDKVMNLVTDAGRGAYVFLDTKEEAAAMFGPRLLTNLEVAARDVHVKVTLPPTFEIAEFHGEQISTNPDEVEPQHLAMGDAMIFHQVLKSCDPASISADAPLLVEATYEDPTTREPRKATFATTMGQLLAGDTTQLRKGDAVVAYAEALKAAKDGSNAEALVAIDKASGLVDEAIAALGADVDLAQMKGLLAKYRGRFDGTAQQPVTPNNKPTNPLIPSCGQCQGEGVEALRCAADLCDDAVYLGSTYTSPTGASVEGTFATMARYGAVTNDLAPQQGGSYVVMATGPVEGTKHSTPLGGTAGTDAFGADKSTPIYDAVEWTVRLKAPPTANGLSLRYVYLSEEYDDYIGTQYNDKFYVVLKAGSTAAGEPTVINFSTCRDQNGYYDFICGQGLEHCHPGQRYCYVAINTALSECCWYNGCPNGTAKTSTEGTGFECSSAAGSDGDAHGSSTGWLETQWPVEPNEEIELTFHLHDTGDGVFDSAVIIDRIVFLENADPGTTGVAK